MPPRIRLLGLLAVAAVLVSLMIASPADARAIAACNGSGLGFVIDTVRPADGIDRNLWALVCFEYDSSGVIHNYTKVSCRWDNQTTLCDMRAEVLHAKLDEYLPDGRWVATRKDNYFGPSCNSCWYTSIFWQGSNYYGVVCDTTRLYQANDFDIRWRPRVTGDLRNAGNAYSRKADPVC